MDYAAARRKMVENQLRANKVTDERLLEAMGALPREDYVPAALKGIAYVDEDVEIAPGRFLLEPMVLARLLQAADLAAGDVTLVVGDAGGYAAALMAQLAGTVLALEPEHALAGPLPQAPYNVILINGAVDVLPEALLGNLAEGGRLVTVQREAGLGRAILVRKIAGSLSKRVLFDAGTPLLTAFAKTPGFVF